MSVNRPFGHACLYADDVLSSDCPTPSRVLSQPIYGLPISNATSLPSPAPRDSLTVHIKYFPNGLL